MRFPLLKLIVILFFSVQTQARMQVRAQPAYVVVPETQVLTELSLAPETFLSPEISILVWNTHKGEAGQAWAADLKKLTQGKHLVLLQEGMNDSFMPGVLQSASHLGWLMAQNFYLHDNQNATGLITGQSNKSLDTFFLRTGDNEPIANTPKLALFTSYQMSNGQPLLVVNIHGINFVPLPAFFRQIDEVTAVIKNWQGKVIFGGDFNTWSPGRTNYLLKKTKEVGLTEARVKTKGLLVLDHIFIRGCILVHMQIHEGIRSSDHKPLTANLNCH